MEFLRDKLFETNRIIDRVLLEFKRPAVMWSSGKDSQVLLYLLRARKVFCDVIFHRPPFMAEKFEFAERMQREWGLRVYDWPPLAVTLQQSQGGPRDGARSVSPHPGPLPQGEGGAAARAPGTATSKGRLEIVNHFRFGAGSSCAIPQDVYEPEKFEEGKWVCGLRDLYHRPRGDFQYRWDVIFHGHKSSDVDPTLGPVPLSCDIQMHEGQPAIAFPLRHWTDDDIWHYSRAADVPQQADRYNIETGEENPDRTTNPDYLAGCTRCLDPLAGPSVFCPKLKCEVGSMRGQMEYHQARRPGYLSAECGPAVAAEAMAGRVRSAESKEVANAI